MSRPIKLTEDLRNDILASFSKAMVSRISGGKISFTRSLTDTKKKAELTFSETAWYKMRALVSRIDKEVAWHGLAERRETKPGEPASFFVSDILVYPQLTTGVTVDTDQEEYQNWLFKQPDGIFKKIRMQGHSHVNMSTSPSSVDTGYYEDMLAGMSDDMFYIFLIWNKKDEHTIMIYDLADNTYYEDSDVKVFIEQDSLGIEKFLAEAEGMVKEKPAYTPLYTSYSKSGYKDSWKDGYRGSAVWDDRYGDDPWDDRDYYYGAYYEKTAKYDKKTQKGEKNAESASKTAKKPVKDPEKGKKSGPETADPAVTVDEDLFEKLIKKFADKAKAEKEA